MAKAAFCARAINSALLLFCIFSLSVLQPVGYVFDFTAKPELNATFEGSFL
jgi:hypothetical protein